MMRTKMKLLVALLAAAVAGIALVLLAGVLDLRPAAALIWRRGRCGRCAHPWQGPAALLPP